jgi:hypothetical protein
VKTWLMYAATGLILTVAGAGLAMLFVPEDAARAVWLGAAIAYAVQLIAFAALIAVRSRNELFLLGWVAGLVLRFGMIGVVAYWLSRSDVVPRTPALISLVAFVFALLLLEPLYLRRGLQTR